jgi:transcriptional regulator with XRE-family HTH domain
VAKLVGISQKQMSQIETNKRPGVQAVTIAKIAQGLHVSTDYLLGLKAEKDGECTGKDCCYKDRRVVFCKWR